MARGQPDWVDISEIKGWDGSALRTLAVDDAGQLYALMKGLYGTTFKSIAVDANGQLYCILRGASGNDILVDANGFITAILKGYDGSNYQNIKVDTAGRIEALIKGMYDTTPTALKVDSAGRIMALLHAMYGAIETALKCDAAGNLMLNVNAQDLAYLTQKPYYGDAKVLTGSVANVGGVNWIELFEITGKIRILGGLIYRTVGDMGNHVFRVELDGDVATQIAISTLAYQHIIPPCSNALRCLCFDTVNDEYYMDLLPNMQSETNFKVESRNPNTSDLATINYNIYYTEAT